VSVLFIFHPTVSLSSLDMAAEESPPWWSRFPPPQRTPQLYSKENLLRQFQILGDILSAGTLIIDVRTPSANDISNKHVLKNSKRSGVRTTKAVA
jgi:hypothetical protein